MWHRNIRDRGGEANHGQEEDGLSECLDAMRRRVFLAVFSLSALAPGYSSDQAFGDRLTPTLVETSLFRIPMSALFT